ncbi:hypothetical protein ACFVRU_49305, partial [Streptomyces sp. NPDC057927]
GNSGGCKITRLDYINCSVIPNNLIGVTNMGIRRGNIIKCAIADSDLTSQTDNLLNAIFDNNYKIINSKDDAGVYFGEMAWLKSKSFIFHHGEYKKYHGDIYNLVDTSVKSTDASMIKSYIGGGCTSEEINKLMSGIGRLTSTPRATAVKDVVWFGVKFNEKTLINNLSFQQGGSVDNSIPSISIQFSDDGTLWTTALSTTLNRNGIKRIININVTSLHVYWRVLANSNSGGSSNFIWVVEECIFYKDEKHEGLTTEAGYEVVSTSPPTLAQFQEKGMDYLSVFDRSPTKFIEPMDDNTEQGEVLGEGRVFKKRIDLNKYFDILKVEVKIKITIS